MRWVGRRGVGVVGSRVVGSNARCMGLDYNALGITTNLTNELYHLFHFGHLIFFLPESTRHLRLFKTFLFGQTV